MFWSILLLVFAFPWFLRSLIAIWGNEESVRLRHLPAWMMLALYILCDRRTSFKERLTPMPVTHSVWIYPAETLKTVVFLSSMWLYIFGVTLTLCVLVGAGWWSVAWVAATVVVVCLMEKLVDHLHECRQI